MKSDFWWMFIFLVIIMIQLLIMIYWKQAKFWTMINILFLFLAIFYYSSYSFKKIVNQELELMSARSKVKKNSLIQQQLTVLPNIVQKWLINSGAMAKEPIYEVCIDQELQMLMDPEQEKWVPDQASQYFTTTPPAFNWFVHLKLNPWLKVVGRDKFDNGQGSMVMKLYSLFPVVNLNNNDKLNQASLQRYLAEIVWFPSAALKPYIKWESIDDYSARAIMEYQGVKGSGVFYFDENGDFKKFKALRYKDINDLQAMEWTVIATKTALLNGLRIPVESQVKWKLIDGDWTWLKVKITAITYNIQNSPIR